MGEELRRTLLESLQPSPDEHGLVPPSLELLHPSARPDRSVPLRRLRCQSLIFLSTAFFAVVLMAGEKLTK